MWEIFISFEEEISYYQAWQKKNQYATFISKLSAALCYSHLNSQSLYKDGEKPKPKRKLLLIYDAQDFILVSYFKGVHFQFITYAEGNRCLLLFLSLSLVKVLLLFDRITCVYTYMSVKARMTTSLTEFLNVLRNESASKL